MIIFSRIEEETKYSTKGRLEELVTYKIKQDVCLRGGVRFVLLMYQHQHSQRYIYIYIIFFAPGLTTGPSLEERFDPIITALMAGVFGLGLLILFIFSYINL